MTLSSIDLNSRYVLFLEIIVDNAKNGKRDFSNGRKDIFIPQTDFIRRGLDKTDIPRLFERGKEESIIAKDKILYQSQGTTPSLELVFLPDEEENKGDIPWYKVSLFSDWEEFSQEVNLIKNRNGNLLYGAPHFDETTSKIIWGDAECELPNRKNEFYICKALFSVPFGHHLSYSQIMDVISPGKEPNQTVYDAAGKLNERALKIFGRKLIRCSNEEAWIDTESTRLSTD